MSKKDIKQNILISFLEPLKNYKANNTEAELCRQEMYNELAMIFANYDKVIQEIKSHPDKYKVITEQEEER